MYIYMYVHAYTCSSVDGQSHMYVHLYISSFNRTPSHQRRMRPCISALIGRGYRIQTVSARAFTSVAGSGYRDPSPHVVLVTARRVVKPGPEPMVLRVALLNG